MFFKKKVKKPVCVVKPHVNKVKVTTATEEIKKEVKKSKKEAVKENNLSEENNSLEK